MTEQVKFVISKLNEAPFNKKFNLISFDALRPEQLLQVLFDTLAYVDPKAKSDLRNEDAEQLSVKVRPQKVSHCQRRWHSVASTRERLPEARESTRSK